MKKYLLQVSYCGDEFYGSQIQKESRTVEKVLKDVVSILLREDTNVRLLSRTDRGVHAIRAWGFFKSEDILEEAIFLKKINAILPPDLKAFKLKEVCTDFNQLKERKSKTYLYMIYSHPYFFPPFLVKRAIYVKEELDVSLMKEAAGYLEGIHDFTPFSATGSPRNSGVRHLNRVKIIKKDNLFVFYFKGEGFLYKMVRLMVGILLEIGKGKCPPSIIIDILGGKKYRRKVAPPYGLYLIS